MADRYWVGGTANWDATAGSKWSLTSGGAGGEAVPTSADDVYIDSGSGAVTVTTGASAVCKDLRFVSGAGSFAGTFAGSVALAMHGSFVASASMTWTYEATITAAATTAQTITTNGKALNCPITFDGVGGSWTLQDALTTGSSRRVTLTNGSLDLNGLDLTCGNFHSNNSNVRSITSGAGQFYITSAASSGSLTVWDLKDATGLTFADRPTVNLTGNGSGTAIRGVLQKATTEATAPNVNITAGTDAVDVQGSGGAAGFFGTLSFVGFSGSLTLAPRTLYGNLTLSPTMTAAAGASTTTFAATSGTQTITSNGVTLDFPVTVNAPGATVQLADALTLGSTRFFTLTAGGLDLNGKNLTAGLFSSSNANVRSITSGAGQFYVTSTSGVPWATNIITNLTMVDRPTVNVTGASGSPILNLGNLAESVVPTVNISTGAGTFGWDGRAHTLTFTGFSGTLTNSGSRTINGNLTLSATMTAGAGTTGTTFAATSGTQVITSNGVALDFPITVNAPGATVQLADALTIGSTRTFTHTAGGLNLNGFNLTCSTFNSSNSNVRSITSGAGQFYCTIASSSGTTTVFNLLTVTNLTLVDRPVVNVTGAGTGTLRRGVDVGAVAEAVAPDVFFSAGSDQAALPLTGTGHFRNVTFTGYSGQLRLGTRNIYGNMIIASAMTIEAGTSTTTFAATSGTQVITSNGVALDFPVTVNAPGATVQLADALTIGSGRALSLSGGTFDANNKNVTCGFYRPSAGAVTRATIMGSETWTILGATTTAWDTPAAASHTVTPGTSTILMTAATAKTFVGGGRTFYNLSQGGAGALSITGANTFNDISNTTQPATVTLPASTTTTVSALSLAGTAGNLVTLNSSTSGTRATLSKASGTVDVSYLSIKDSAATGGASFFAQTGNGNINAGNNTGWSFATRAAVTGVEATGSVGDASATAGASTSPTGVSATSTVEAVTFSILVALAAVGLQAVGDIGTASVTANASASATGVEAIGVAGDVSITASATTATTGVPASGSVGTAAVALPRTVNVTGLQAVGSIGTVATTAGSNVYVSGIQALGLIAQTLVWGVIDTAETANWSLVDDGNTVTWVEIPT